MQENIFLGVDAGSVSLKISLKKNNQVTDIKEEHYGDPCATYHEIIKKLDLKSKTSQGLISGKYSDIISSEFNIPPASIISCLTDTINKGTYEKIRYFADIGSSGIRMLELQDSKFQGYTTNSLCAAGTGAFLDQQMKRMGLNYEKINTIPISENPPNIASRCAVFAKSDLIHHQQNGFTIEQLWNGLVKGLAEAAYSTLFGGRQLTDGLFLTGGIANNHIFLHHFRKLVNSENLRVAPCPDFFWSRLLLDYLLEGHCNHERHSEPVKEKKVFFEQPLVFEEKNKSKHITYTDRHDNEVDIWDLKEESQYEVYAGLDIGSTSTKTALLNKDGKILAGLYRRTAGDPVSAFRMLLHGIADLEEKHEVKIEIKGFGTTGSGRKLIAQFAGADVVKNEITAHLKGAIKEFPGVKTIFEIGGQDSKYILVEDLWMKDANMNYVCAAGTGSFLEEQAKNLNVDLKDIALFCKDAVPPVSSDRCTVFMEQDVNQLLAKGYTRNQAMSSVLYSVCKNYLNKVVQNRPVKEPILFLGATAKNSGLVKAFENVLGKGIYTSRYSHLMGAIGMAEILRMDPPEKTKFHGKDLRYTEAELREEQCSLCNNKCRITHMLTYNGTKKASWGYMCGKEPHEEKVKKSDKDEAIRFLEGEINKPLVPPQPKASLYFPRHLQYFTFNPFFQRFFHELDIQLKTGPSTNEDILANARSYQLTDICYPMKAATGHLVYAVKQQQLPVFAPYIIQDKKNPRAGNSFFCPLSQSFPSIIRSILDYNNIKSDRIISPIIDFSKDSGYNIKQLYKTVGKRFGLTKQAIRRAFLCSVEKEEDLKQKLIQYGENILEKLRSRNKPIIVILGRNYNILDKKLNSKLIDSISRSGFDVVPMDILPLRRDEMPSQYHDMYWSYGQKVINAANYITGTKDLYPVFLTNFSCGPDSFLLNIYEKILNQKPSLILELDEHGGDAGYLTRLEAFFDRVSHHFSQNKTHEPLLSSLHKNGSSLSGYRIYIPPMHPFGTRLVSAALRSQNIEAVPLLKEDAETFATGKQFVRGSECMPAASTIGSFIHKLREEQTDKPQKRALFMPCTDGPCRFGQYRRLHDQILKDLNLSSFIFSPNSDDNYSDIKGSFRLQFLKALILADILLKLSCCLRPYEKNKGEVDDIIEKAVEIIERKIEKKERITPFLKKLNKQLLNTPVVKQKKPLIGIVGEIYVRNSPFSNSDLIRQIESYGGEAWIAPMMEWVHYTTEFKKTGNPAAYLEKNLFAGVLNAIGNRYQEAFSEILSGRKEPPIKEVVKYAEKHLPKVIEGESVLTIGRAVGFIKGGADMVINVAPFGCMPGSISSSILKNVSRKLNIPVVSLFYDGERDFSELMEVYIKNAGLTKKGLNQNDLKRPIVV